MAVKLKKLSEQVIVIAGASSGIGLATAQLAAERGATVVLADRSDETLEKLGTACELQVAGLTGGKEP